MRRILVTGGAGFLGSHLVLKLLSNGNHVTVLDDLCTGVRSNVPAGADFIQADVCEPLTGEYDDIYHLACAASPDKYQAQPLQTLRTNFLGTTNVLELARRCRASVLFTSTSEVYGDPQVSPQSEGYWGNVNSFGPRSCYDEGKRVSESLCYSYADCHQVRIRIARIFNTYGPRMAPDDGRVVSNFLVQALRNLPVTIYGDGSQTRSLCYVDDQIRGLLALLQAEGANLEAPANIGNPHEMTVKEIAKAALRICGSSSKLDYRPLPKDDPARRCPDIQRAKDWFGWEPRVSVEEGLQLTADYFRGILN